MAIIPRIPHIFHATQAAADALVAEALEDPRFCPLPDLPQSNNALRIILGAWFVSGSITLPRGWVRSCMLACHERGAPCPAPRSLRWFRSKMADSPSYFAGMRGLDRDLLEQMDVDLAP